MMHGQKNIKSGVERYLGRPHRCASRENSRWL